MLGLVLHVSDVSDVASHDRERVELVGRRLGLRAYVRACVHKYESVCEWAWVWVWCVHVYHARTQAHARAWWRGDVCACVVACAWHAHVCVCIRACIMCLGFGLLPLALAMAVVLDLPVEADRFADLGWCACIKLCARLCICLCVTPEK